MVELLCWCFPSGFYLFWGLFTFGLSLILVCLHSDLASFRFVYVWTSTFCCLCLVFSSQPRGSFVQFYFKTGFCRLKVFCFGWFSSKMFVFVKLDKTQYLKVKYLVSTNSDASFKCFVLVAFFRTGGCPQIFSFLRWSVTLNLGF